jgi:hypothetical protein
MTIAEKIKAAAQKVNQDAGSAPEVATVSSTSLKVNGKSGITSK